MISVIYSVGIAYRRRSVQRYKSWPTAIWRSARGKRLADDRSSAGSRRSLTGGKHHA